MMCLDRREDLQAEQLRCGQALCPCVNTGDAEQSQRKVQRTTSEALCSQPAPGRLAPTELPTATQPVVVARAKNCTVGVLQ